MFDLIDSRIAAFLAAHPEYTPDYARKVSNFAAVRGQRWDDKTSNWVYTD